MDSAKKFKDKYPLGIRHPGYEVLCLASYIIDCAWQHTLAGNVLLAVVASDNGILIATEKCFVTTASPTAASYMQSRHEVKIPVLSVDIPEEEVG